MANDVKDILIANGISPSYHRLKIYEYLASNRTHPTADMIYEEVIRQIPTLSKTTIYNTLKTLSEKGLVSSITIEDNEVRYDADLTFHGHFKCINCGALYDIDLEQMNIDKRLSVSRKIHGHQITERQIYLKGLCKKCNK